MDRWQQRRREQEHARKIAEAAKAAAEVARAKSDEDKRKEEAVQTHARLKELERLAKGQHETQTRLRHERYQG